MMQMTMGSRLEEMQVQDQKLDTAMALSEIRTQLQELTKSVESCQSEVHYIQTCILAVFSGPIKGLSVHEKVYNYIDTGIVFTYYLLYAQSE